jgi:hypothetical protein
LGSADVEAAAGAEVAEETTVTTGASLVTTVTAGAACSAGVEYWVGAGAGTVTGIVVPSVSVT